MINTSQDPEYVGPTGHEKRIHKTHFGVDWNIKFKSKKNKKFHWVEIAPGRYKLIRNAKGAPKGGR